MCSTNAYAHISTVMHDSYCHLNLQSLHRKFPTESHKFRIVKFYVFVHSLCHITLVYKQGATVKCAEQKN